MSSTSRILKASLYRITSFIFRLLCDNFTPGRDRLYHKRRAVETKYKQVKQKLELENFSGRLVDNIKQDFYAMMTAANMLAGALREANRKIARSRTKKEGMPLRIHSQCEPRGGCFEGPAHRNAGSGEQSYPKTPIPGTGIGDKTADSPYTSEPPGCKERIPEKAAFPPQPQIKLLIGGAWHSR
jgi:hypothetical protein